MDINLTAEDSSGHLSRQISFIMLQVSGHKYDPVDVKLSMELCRKGIQLVYTACNLQILYTVLCMLTGL